MGKDIGIGAVVGMALDTGTGIGAEIRVVLPQMASIRRWSTMAGVALVEGREGDVRP